jgi:4-amino-4-deoxy-L-arabinose transferase-like glycosyltransferase
MSVHSRPGASPEAGYRRGVSLLFLTGILLIGLFLRVYGLEREAFWFDEAGSMPALDDRDVMFVMHNETRNHDMVPLYFVLQYFWVAVFGDSPVAIRCLSILFGMLAFPLLYALGKEIAGWRTALLACFMLACSPFQIIMSQEVRPYSLLLLLSLASAWSFHRIVHEGGRVSWWSNMTANVLLVHTHLFGLWLLIAQGICLLAFRRRSIKTIASWTAIQVVALIPLSIHVLSWENPGDPPLGFAWVDIPMTWFFMDTFRLAQVILHWDPAQHVQSIPAVGAFLAPALLLLMVVLAGFMVIGLILFIVRALRGPRWEAAAGIVSNPGEKPVHGVTAAYLLIWYLLPAVLLGLFSVLAVPSYQIRYCLYSAPAGYFILSNALLGLRPHYLRLALTSTLMISFVLMAALAKSFPMRMDYFSAASYFHEEGGSGEPIILCPSHLRDTFEYNVATASSPLISTDTLPKLMFVLEDALAQSERVWLFLDSVPPDLAARWTGLLQRHLSLRRLDFEQAGFLGRLDQYFIQVRHRPEFWPIEDARAMDAYREGLPQGSEALLLRWFLAGNLMRAARPAEAAAQYQAMLETMPWETATSEEIGEELVLAAWASDIGGSTSEFATTVARALCEALLAAAQLEDAQETYQDLIQRLPVDRALLQDLEAKLFPHTG